MNKAKFGQDLSVTARMGRGTKAASWSERFAWKSTRHTIWYTLVMVILLAGSVVMLFPLAWQISSSLKGNFEIYQWPPRLIPNPPRWQNYPQAVTLIPFWLYARNTIFITSCALVGTVASCALCAYAFALLRAPGKNVLFVILLGTMMLPGQVTMIPIFIMFSKLNWINTFYPLIVPTFFGNAFYIFLLRQFFLSLPPELADAVKIDGGGYWTMFSRVVVPLSRPALTTVAIFSFMAHWNDFFTPLLYITSDSKRTLALGLMVMQANYFGGRQYMHLVMAASVLMLIPVLTLYGFAQRVFVQGVSLTGIAGR